jgi:hypothetical protein
MEEDHHHDCDTPEKIDLRIPCRAAHA